MTIPTKRSHNVRIKKDSTYTKCIEPYKNINIQTSGAWSDDWKAYAKDIREQNRLS